LGIKIPCPTCGPRDQTEFTFGGELRPLSAATPDEEFARVYLRENAAGAQDERWFHLFGCRRWLTVRRDTTTNRFEP
jgi:heterotetrameric sarcosine oxidase delta subunit